MAKKKLKWVTDLPTDIIKDGEFFVAIRYSEKKFKSMPTYLDPVTGKRKRYNKVFRKKIKGVWVTYVR